MNGGGGREPVTWTVLHWQRCTVAPEAVAMALASVAALAPQMQKVVGRRRRQTNAAATTTDSRATSAKNEGLVGADNQCGDRLPPPTSFPSLFILSLLILSVFLLLPVLIAFSPPPIGSSRSLAGPAHWRRAARRTSGNVTGNSKLQCIMDTCTQPHARSIFLQLVWFIMEE